MWDVWVERLGYASVSGPVSCPRDGLELAGKLCTYIAVLVLASGVGGF